MTGKYVHSYISYVCIAVLTVHYNYIRKYVGNHNTAHAHKYTVVDTIVDIRIHIIITHP